MTVLHGALTPCECGCGELVRRRFAPHHYRRIQGAPKPARPIVERFMEKVEKVDSGCWEWLADKSRNGYGRFFLRKHANGTSDRIYAHRFAYEQFVGPIPDGLEIDHLCRNKACVNPDHLEPVTREENMQRIPFAARPSHMKPQTHCKRGHELTPENVFISPKGRQCLTCRRASARDRMRVKRRQEREDRGTA